MNNRSFYAIIAFVAVVGLLLHRGDYPTAKMIVRVFICGGAFYYVYSQYLKRRSVTLMMLVMLVVGIVYNPLFLLPLSPVAWVITHIVVAAIFYLIARATPLEESFIKKERGDELEEP